MSYETSDGTTHIPKTEARAGQRVKGMPIVLGLSTLAAIVLLGLAFAFLA
jgi:hypothetical protein